MRRPRTLQLAQRMSMTLLPSLLRSAATSAFFSSQLLRLRRRVFQPDIFVIFLLMVIILKLPVIAFFERIEEVRRSASPRHIRWSRHRALRLQYHPPR
jgi:hypothetical protein